MKFTLNEKLKTIMWSFGLAWRMNKVVLIIWMTLSIGLSILPAISIIFNNKVISYLSNYLANSAEVQFEMIVPQICGLGITMICIGISSRVNRDLIYMMMYDSYYLGMEELLMDNLQKMEIEDLFKSEINDEYNYIIGRAGSLTDIMSGACALIGKIVSIASLLTVAQNSSQIVFWVSFLYICIIFIVNFVFTERVRWDTSEYRKVSRVADYYENLVTIPGTAKEIRVFDSMEFVVRKWKNAFQNAKNYQKKRFYEIELRNLISGGGFYIFLILMISSNLFLLAEGKLQVGVFLMLFTLCINIYVSISGLARDIMSFDYGLFALERQRKFMENIPNYVIEKKHACENEKCCSSIFEVNNVSFSYHSGDMVLKNISFEINRGEIVAIVGKNGSGKTTLIKLLLGMFTPNSGSIKLLGIPYEGYRKQDIRDKIGVFFQDFYLFHATIKENIGYGNIREFNNEKKINEALRKAGCDNIISKLRNGLNSILGKDIYNEGVELSGGEKQRIAVSRAYMNSKEILIFDEPSSALDPVAETELLLNIRDTLEGQTAILVSHRVGFCRLADRIIVLDDGKIVEVGTHSELLSKNGVYADFFNGQAEWYQVSSKEEK